MGAKKLVFTFCLLITNACWSLEGLRSLSASEDTIERDLKLILKKAEMGGQINVEHVYEYGDYARISCRNSKVKVKVYSLSKEWSSTFYYALQKLGFLFPHPRIQITPSKDFIRKSCGKKIVWKPALKYRGFHLHTLHPNEWVQGFLQGKSKIAEDTIRWLARNQQNVFDLSLLRMPSNKIYEVLKAPFKLAKSFGIHTGVAFGIAFHQQNSYKLVSLVGAYSNDLSRREISRNLNTLLENLDLSFINVESGTSEFTPVNFKRTLNWLNQISRIAKKKNVKMFNKVHISSNQSNEEYGNYNFLPQHANAEVGVLPHTVFYYGLNDPKAPMYGNKNFHQMRDFMLEQKDQRRTWYYPETSYWIAMDIGLPLLHLEYLRARAEDMKFLFENQIEGQLTFTTGHELGYWLADWTVALMNNTAYNFDPLTPFRLLGEDTEVWQKHLNFQHKHFTLNQLVSTLTFPNPMDELLPKHSIHERNLVGDLVDNRVALEREIFKLASALSELPKVDGIKNTELKSLLAVTYGRIQHALWVRKALLTDKEKHLKQASLVRKQAKKTMALVMELYNRYPSAQLFERHSNLTAYQWGYGYTAKKLHYWRREEEQVETGSYHAFFMNIYNFFDILL